jgi:heterodisulfide reductase subunit C
MKWLYLYVRLLNLHGMLEATFEGHLICRICGMCLAVCSVHRGVASIVH